MNSILLVVCVAQLVVVGLLLIRLARGPSVSDRVVALNTVSTESAVVVLFFGALVDRTIYLDAAMWLASFSYLGALVWARYLERGLL